MKIPEKIGMVMWLAFAALFFILGLSYLIEGNFLVGIGDFLAGVALTFAGLKKIAPSRIFEEDLTGIPMGFALFVWGLGFYLKGSMLAVFYLPMGILGMFIAVIKISEAARRRFKRD